MPVQLRKTQEGATLNRALGMMCDLREWVLEGAVSFFPHDDKCSAVLSDLGRMVTLDFCPPGLAKEIFGELGWMFLGVAGRLGRAGLHPFIERACESGHRTWTLNGPMREAICFYNTLLAPAALTPRRCRLDTRMYTHVLLYTDASEQGLGVLLRSLWNMLPSRSWAGRENSKDIQDFYQIPRPDQDSDCFSVPTQARRSAAKRGGRNLNSFKDVRTENGASQGRNLALTGLFFPSSLDKFARQRQLAARERLCPYLALICRDHGLFLS